jgi:crossover junction endodeoxyribonuclease RusA
VKEYTVTLPYPPSVNNLFINVARGRVISKRYAAWRTDAHWTIKRTPGPRFSEPVAVEIILGKPDRRKRDLDNAIKAPLDALVEMHVITDDSLIQRIEAQWGAVKGAVITVRPFER